ncbi:MAG: xanthine dehydrogenase family protein subunit M [Alphaproteobacteria bacterium]|nr:xanthine dehydrogenase family protein subunit M [Alphaproteobacteria bacterium]
MKPAPFDYHAPRSIEEAAGLLASLDNAKVLAGGQSLVPMMNFRYVIIDHIVDLAKVEGLAGISVTGAILRIGAMTRQRDLEFSPEVAQHCPLLREALSHVGHRQTRNRGTIGGSLAHADPAAEQPTVCAAHDAVIEIASARGTRRVPFAEFAVAFLTTAVEPDEIVTAIEIPLWPAGHGYSFHEFARRRGDFAIVGAAALLDLAPDQTVRRASLTLCGIATGPLRMTEAEQVLTGKRFDRGVAQAAAAAVKAITPVSDIHASAGYRRHLAEVLAFRALRDAAARCSARI